MNDRDTVGRDALLDFKAPKDDTYSLRVYDFRSEEHTSELQSRRNLVCRLLLEKKNNKSCK